MVFLFVHWLSIRGRYNFANLARYASINEKTLRNHFKKDFAWLDFNVALCQKYLSSHRIIAVDPTYVSKSGKRTQGTGYFWSGQAGATKWGMEFCGLAAVDLSDKTALPLLAVQTTHLHEGETLLEYYASLIMLNAEALRKISKHVVCDAFFSRYTYCQLVCEADFELTSRLRVDQVLRYLYTQPQRSGPGRPRQFDGRVNPRQLRKDVFTPCAQDPQGAWIAYSACVNVKALKRNCRVVVVHDLKDNGEISAHRIYFSTDQTLDGGEVLHHYQSRYQQEFLFRDAKQELGLEQAQAYTWQKNDFHVNCALTVVSLAKAAHALDQQKPGQCDEPFSIADIKTEYFNENQALIILEGCTIDANSPKIIKFLKRFKFFGKRRA